MTSSFVSRILEHADQLEQKSIQEKLDILTMKLSEMEVEMHQLAESKYVHFHPNLFTADSLLHRVHDIHNQMSAVECKVHNEIKGQLSSSVKEYQNICQELSEAQTILHGLAYLADIHELLETSARSLESKMYSQAATALHQLQALFQRSLTCQDDKIHILAAMKAERQVQLYKLESDLCDLWKDSVKWEVQTSPSETAGGMVVRELSVSVMCSGGDCSQLQQVVEGLHVTNLLGGRMAAFADWFQDYLVPFLTEHLHLSTVVKTADQMKTLHIHSQHGPTLSRTGPDSNKSISQEKIYAHVFANLINILENLHSLFLHIEYGGGEADKQNASSTIDTAGQGTLMSLLGHSVSASLLDLLKGTVLTKAVPSCAKDLDGFTEVIAATQLLHDHLLALNFIDPDNTSLLDYVHNVHILFANKKSQLTLEHARTLMTSDLHENVAVAEDKPLGEWPPLTRGGVKKGDRTEIVADQKLSDNTMRMPRCRVSVHIQTLMGLAYDTLHEASESSLQCATQMFYAVRNMFELFYLIVPTHHGQQFENLPQIAALHYNNCMFIAHHLLTLGHQFASKLPNTESLTFVDLIQKIRQSGVQVFMSQVNRQCQLLLECLDGAEGFSQVDKDSRLEAANKAIKQVMLQLGHLQKIWKPVLPTTIYKKAMGRLIGYVVEKLTYSITSLEDIAQEAGNRLTHLLSPLEHGCGELITSPGEVASAELLRHIPGWARLTELTFMLGASLSDIADRWAEGMGPLAVSFSSVEVKQLIRALFQNTDRRANILATIK